MKKTCLIIAGGTLNYKFAGAFLKNNTFDKTIAVDGGLVAFEELNLTPSAIVGDFDTISRDVLEIYRKKEGIIWDEHKPEKDETDTELAFRAAEKLGCDDLTILGATGGRMDHTIGNIHLLFACLKRGIHACILDEKNKIYLLDTAKTFNLQDLWGKYISFLPLTEEVHGITLIGFRYPLNLKDIGIGTSLCISNELTGKTGKITFTQGVLICIESHD